MFPEGSTEKPSEALPAIWQDWDEFVAISEQMKTDAKQLSEIAGAASSADAIKAQFAAVGKSCGSCHEKFRLKQ
jgi:cytochrome c556